MLQQAPHQEVVLVVEGGGGSRNKERCHDENALNYSPIGTHNQSLCIYDNTEDENILGGGETCEVNTWLHQNMKAGDRTGQYSSWQKGTITEVKLLQAHMNRLGFNAGPIDGILGPLTDGAIRRMQVSLGFTGNLIDGYVGPLTRERINNSCREEAIQEETQTSVNCHINYTRLIKLGTIGEDVKQVQTCMNSLGYSTGIVDGWYGKNTYAGITAYQRAQGLQYIDGIVGPETSASLNALSE